MDLNWVELWLWLIDTEDMAFGTPAWGSVQLSRTFDYCGFLLHLLLFFSDAISFNESWNGLCIGPMWPRSERVQAEDCVCAFYRPTSVCSGGCHAGRVKRLGRETCHERRIHYHNANFVLHQMRSSRWFNWLNRYQQISVIFVNTP